MKFTKKHKNNQSSKKRKEQTWEKFKNQQNNLSANRRGIKR
ncbi:hypothetical protein [Apilactobacillus xinyiensis]|jgi:hypothetical protein|nr:hypothetical protein [Apilactobacillus xinyiensis]